MNKDTSQADSAVLIVVVSVSEFEAGFSKSEKTVNMYFWLTSLV